MEDVKENQSKMGNLSDKLHTKTSLASTEVKGEVGSEVDLHFTSSISGLLVLVPRLLEAEQE